MTFQRQTVEDAFERDPIHDHREAVAPDVGDARLDESWSAIQGRLNARPERPRRRIAALGGALAAAAAALLTFFAWPQKAPLWAGTTLTTGEEVAEVRLPEGTEIAAEPQSELERVTESDREVRLAIHEGAAFFDVARRPDRLFAVEAGAVEVRVVGTAFRVGRADGRVTVDVERGVVDVRRGEEIVRLRAGESWEGEARAPEPEQRAAAQPVPIGPAPDADRSRARRPRGPTADELFTEAGERRRGGDPRGAARLYERFLSRNPGDSRAALAAFELGRIRLDTLSDPHGAAAAFRRSLAAGGGSPFAQDARARLVEAYDAAGNAGACRRAKAVYLARHPEGRHALDVTRACE